MPGLKPIVYATLCIGAGLCSVDAYSACALGTCIDARPSISGGRPSGGGHA